MLLARRNLARDRLRLSLSIAGVALSVMLILVLSGYLAGIYRQASAYLDHAPGSILVAQRGVRTFVGSSSFLTSDTLEAVRTTAGVERAVPIIVQTVILELHGRKEAATIVGYDRTLGGGPWDLAEGREPAADDEIVLDRVMAGQHGIAVGDRVTVLGRDMVVVGTSRGTALWIGSYAFARASAVQDLARAPDTWSEIFVTPAPGISDEQLQGRIRSAGAEAFAKADKVEADRKGLGRIYDAPLGLMVGISFIVGVLVVGLVIYTATSERRREFGTLKAIGMPNGGLYRIVAGQALIVAVAGWFAGILLADALAVLLATVRPQFAVVIEPGAIAAALLASVAMALAAALAPARTMARLAPAEVFR